MLVNPPPYLYESPVLLQLITHERDILKKDVKRISLERDGAYKHLSLTTAAAAHAASQAVHGTKTSSQQAAAISAAGQHHSTSIATSPTTLESGQHHDVHGTHPSSHQIGHQLIPHSAPPQHHRTASDTGTAAPSPSSMAASAIGKTGESILAILA